MFSRQVYVLAAGLALSVLVAGSLTSPYAIAAPNAAYVTARRADVERSVAAYRKASNRLAAIESRISRTSADLDTVVAKQEEVQARLSNRATHMYREGQTSYLAVILNARSFEEFASRWTALTQINRDDAETIRELKAVRSKVRRSAKSLVRQQELAAEQVRALERIAAQAKKTLASSQAEYAEYVQRTAAMRATPSVSPRASAAKSDGSTGDKAEPSSQQAKRGAGAWRTAVASHYGASFTGRGASGERIGPTSMIVAHKTLPFGTFVEIRYRGRTAVARVADRGPYTPGRTFDLGPGLVRVLNFSGVEEIQYRIIGE